MNKTTEIKNKARRASMERFDTKAEDKELIELINQISKAYKKKISRLLQLLKKNNFLNREAVRRLVRQAREKNADLYLECHSLYRFLKEIESKMDLQ